MNTFQNKVEKIPTCAHSKRAQMRIRILFESGLEGLGTPKYPCQNLTKSGPRRRQALGKKCTWTFLAQEKAT